MRKLVFSLGLAVHVASTAAAQQPMPWNTEIGIRSVVGQLDVDGIGVRLVQLPAGAGVQGFGGGASLYGILPVGGRFAIEPLFGLADQSVGATNVTTMNAGVRLLFSAWRRVYLAAGPSVDLLKFAGQEDARFGGQVAAGYRFQVGGAVSGRAEVFYESLSEGELFATEASSTLGLAFGLGMGVGERPAARGGPRANARMWDLALGVQGGYTHFTVPGSIDVSTFALPGVGSGSGLVTFPIPSMNPWFVQIPVGERFAVEPSFSYNSYAIEDDGGNASTYSVGLRLNYAFDRVAYAAVSGEMNGLGGDAFDGLDGATGVGLAAGLRFPLVAGLRGRTEISYRTFMAGDNNPFGDHQITGLAFGVIAPLN